MKIISKLFAFVISTTRIKYHVLREILNQNESKVLTFENTQSPSYLKDVGWFTSINKKENIFKDELVPWVSYPFIEFLMPRLKDDFSVFEFGMGSSTVFFSKKCKDVVAVEHDNQWYMKTKENLKGSSNIGLKFRALENGYSKTINENDKEYDIIFIDGRKRLECLKNSISHLSNKGVIILDNSDRAKYKDAFGYMSQSGFKEITISGLVIAHYMKSSSTIFYKVKNCLGI